MFYDVRFPDDISTEFKKTINFDTEVNMSKNLNEQRIKLLDYCYSTYEINYTNITNNNLERIISFFTFTKGRYLSFRFKDWLDYKVSNQIIGVYSDNNEFQLIKSYNINSSNNKMYTRTITKPVKNTVEVYVNGAKNDNFSINYTTGILTMKSALADGDIITASFEFDVHVRFFSDELTIKNITKNISKIEELKFVEILQ